jgi:hypothetical protein
MAPPRGDRKNGKGAGGKTDLRPDRNQFKRHRKEDAAAEQGDGEGERQQSAALLAAASDEADFPRGKRRAARSRNTPVPPPCQFCFALMWCCAFVVVLRGTQPPEQG